MTGLDRRRFLLGGAAVIGGGVLAPTMVAGPAHARTATPGESPYGSLEGRKPDKNGVILPKGFTSRVIAVAGEPVEGTEHPWHVFPDGAATFPDGNGGWYYACNSEVFHFMVPDSGGVSAIHFGPEGEILEAYPILAGSNSNCAGGPTPWGTWLSCEENFEDQGRVWECDPTGQSPAVAHEAMGRWAHEAAAIDPVAEHVYLTEDRPDGVLYRFTPNTYPDLSAGLLEVATVKGKKVSWTEIPDPSGAETPTRLQVPGATVFNGGEGIWHHDGFVYFTTKGDNSVHSIDVAEQKYERIWSAGPEADPVTGVLTGVDNITVASGTGDLFVAEDGGNMEVVIITPDGQVAPFCRLPGQEVSEITGPCFDPSGTRLYFSSQRGPTPKTIGELIPGFENEERFGGVTYEITGPFLGTAEAAPETTSTTAAPTTTEAPATTAATTTTEAATTPATEEPATTPSPVTTLANAAAADAGDDGGSGLAIGVGVAAAAAAAIGAVVFVARRRSRTEEASEAPEADTP